MVAPRLLRKLVIEHRALECARPFDEVHSALVASLPALKPELSEILARGEKDKVEHAVVMARSYGCFSRENTAN